MSRAGTHDGEVSWSREEVSHLKRALVEIPREGIDRNERFRLIARRLSGRSKRDCYDKYKQLKAEKKVNSRANGAEAKAQQVLRDRFAECHASDSSFGAWSVASDDVPHAGSAAGQLGQSHQKQRTERDNGPECDILELEIDEVHEEVAYTPRHGAVPDSLHRGGGGGGGGSCNGSYRNASSSSSSSSPPLPITAAEAVRLREILFGDTRKTFNTAWLQQGFCFNDVPGLAYGLVQHEGGPCGVVAVVQAFLIGDMLAEDDIETTEPSSESWSNPSPRRRHAALIKALATIIWQSTEPDADCSDEKHPERGSGGGGRGGDRDGRLCSGRSRSNAVLAVPYAAAFDPPPRYKPDSVTERLWLHMAPSLAVLEDLLLRHAAHFTEPRGYGAVLLVTSCLLSRGLAAAAGDPDQALEAEPPCLMARHGYAAQELINLLLIGRATSNVFDGVRRMDDTDSAGCASGGGGTCVGSECKKCGGGGGSGRSGEGKCGDGDGGIVLRGIPRRGRVGFLTLFEAYKYLHVGDFYKTPRAPVWVVCSESHYTVLCCPSLNFGDGADPRGGGGGGCDGGERYLKLYYYDQLAQQDEIIRLTIDTRPPRPPPPPGDDGDGGQPVPPLDLVIRTRWEGAAVNWNGTDPIL